MIFFVWSMFDFIRVWPNLVRHIFMMNLKINKRIHGGRSDQTGAKFLLILMNHSICPSVLHLSKFSELELTARSVGFSKCRGACFGATEIPDRFLFLKEFMETQNFMIINLLTEGWEPKLPNQSFFSIFISTQNTRYGGFLDTDVI